MNMGLLDAPTEPASDDLTSLEERIRRIVELVGELRRENAALAQGMKAAATEREQAAGDAAEARAQAAGVKQELESLRAERSQVRGRIERLLGQMDLLGPG